MEQLLTSETNCGVRQEKNLTLHPHTEPKEIQGVLSLQCWSAVCYIHSNSSRYLPNTGLDFLLLKENGLLSVLNLVTSALSISRLL